MTGRVILWAAAALALPVGTRSQTGNVGVLASAQTPSAVSSPAAQEIFRRIDDPHSGQVWLLLRDPQHAGGPGLLVLAVQTANPPVHGTRNGAAVAERLPVIRAGDALVVEEHSPVVDAQLEAIALESAARGGALKARLRIGGKVVRVVALARGRAVFAQETEGSR